MSLVHYSSTCERMSATFPDTYPLVRLTYQQSNSSVRKTTVNGHFYYLFFKFKFDVMVYFKCLASIYYPTTTLFTIEKELLVLQNIDLEKISQPERVRVSTG